MCYAYDLIQCMRVTLVCQYSIPYPQSVAGLGIQLSTLPILNGGLTPVLTNHADSQVFARGLGGSTLVFRRWFDDEQGKSNSEEPLTSP